MSCIGTLLTSFNQGQADVVSHVSAAVPEATRLVTTNTKPVTIMCRRVQVHMERLGTTANRMSGLAVESAYLCGLFANAVRGDHRMLADGMHPVVLMTDQQHSRALRHAATIMPQAFPNGQPPSAAAPASSPSRQASADAIPRISINPGVRMMYCLRLPGLHVFRCPL